MKPFVLIFSGLLLLFSCTNKNENKPNNSQDINKLIVQDFKQVGQYTYIFGEKDGEKKWFAAPLMQLEKGKTYYYKKEMEIMDFHSKELNKTFDKIYFLNKLSANPDMKDSPQKTTLPTNTIVTHRASKPKMEKIDVNIKPEPGVIPIADLYKNPSKYNGKDVRVKGTVTKYNPAILKRNWIHIQDGTDYKGKFDFTATISEVVKKGDIVTLEGKISVDKDYGYGYTYELIMEDAKIIK